jgi:hypothetical protein
MSQNIFDRWVALPTGAGGCLSRHAVSYFLADADTYIEPGRIRLRFTGCLRNVSTRSMRREG